ncbi:MAG TPA: hypothetical protein VFH62_00445 [Dehalococcoidia bacterium]|nr:hypothetical protein [Dehalococcoidia bacterium]
MIDESRAGDITSSWNERYTRGADVWLIVTFGLCVALIVVAFFPWAHAPKGHIPRHALDEPTGVLLVPLAAALAWLSALRACEGIPKAAYSAGAVAIGLACVVAAVAYYVTAIGSCDTSLADACPRYEPTLAGYAVGAAVVGIAASTLAGAFSYVLRMRTH